MFSKLALVALVAAAGVSAHQSLITPNAANGNYELDAANTMTCDNWVQPASTGSWALTADQMVMFSTNIIAPHGGGNFTVGVWVSGTATGNMTFTTGTPATVTGGMMYPDMAGNWNINATLPSDIGTRGVVQLGMMTSATGAADYYQCVYYTVGGASTTGAASTTGGSMGNTTTGAMGNTTTGGMGNTTTTGMGNTSVTPSPSPSPSPAPSPAPSSSASTLAASALLAGAALAAF